MELHALSMILYKNFPNSLQKSPGTPRAKAQRRNVFVFFNGFCGFSILWESPILLKYDTEHPEFGEGTEVRNTIIQEIILYSILAEF